MTVCQAERTNQQTETKDVLIVEDDPATRQLLKAVIESIPVPCSVREADRGEQALQLVRQRRPDLILLDIVLANSELSGIGVCQELRRDPLSARTAVIVVTACQEESIGTACLALGVLDFIEKPFSVADLRERLRGWLET